jgi:dihydroneopterin aldolase
MNISNYRLFIDRLELEAEIGIHDFERGRRQRIFVSIELEIDPAGLPQGDCIGSAFDYDWVRNRVREIVRSRTFELQETLARAIVDVIAERREIVSVVVSTSKPDVYPDAGAVGCRLEARR